MLSAVLVPLILSFAAGPNASPEDWIARLSAPERRQRRRALRELLRAPLAEREALLARAQELSFEVREAARYAREFAPPEPFTVTVPAGTYQIGSSNLFDDNRPTTVELGEFVIDGYEVTNLDYLAFLEATGTSPPAHWSGGTYAYGRDACPVTWLSFEEAQAYARWVGGRLPTAAEWEVAAHAGQGQAFPWGNEPLRGLQHVAGRPVPVGIEARDVAPTGCRDMAGSAAEWVLLEGGRPGYRGGHFAAREVEQLRVVARFIEVPGVRERRPHVGLRVVRSP